MNRGDHQPHSSNMDSDQRKIRILVIDDHDLVRAGLIALLNHEKDIRIVGEARTCAEAVEKAKALSPDVALIDINMPAIENIETAAMIGREYPDVKILTVTHLDHEEYMRKIMESGARGCISKSCTAEELKQAIRIVHGDGEYFSFMARKEPIHDAPTRTGGKPAVDLTRRELEVIRRVASGLTSEEIAAELGISIRTVEFHRANIKEKTGARDAISLVRFALENKIISIDLRE